MKFERYFYYYKFNESSITFTFHCEKESFKDKCINYIIYQIIATIIGIILPIIGITLLSICLDIRYLLLIIPWIIAWLPISILLYNLILNKKFDLRNRTKLKEREQYYKELEEREKEKYKDYIDKHPLEYKCKKALENNPHYVADLIRYVKDIKDLHEDK